MGALVDTMYRNHKKNQAWILALINAVTKIEADRQGKPPEEIMSQLKKQQKIAYQKLLERLETRDPGYAAQIDDRDISEIE